MKISFCLTGTGRKLSLVGGIGDKTVNRLPIVLEDQRTHIFKKSLKFTVKKLGVYFWLYTKYFKKILLFFTTS